MSTQCLLSESLLSLTIGFLELVGEGIPAGDSAGRGRKCAAIARKGVLGDSAADGGDSAGGLGCNIRVAFFASATFLALWARCIAELALSSFAAHSGGGERSDSSCLNLRARYMEETALSLSSSSSSSTARMKAKASYPRRDHTQPRGGGVGCGGTGWDGL